MKLALALALPSSLVVLALTGALMSSASSTPSEVSTTQEAEPRAPLASIASLPDGADASDDAQRLEQAFTHSQRPRGDGAKVISLDVGATATSERAALAVEIVNHLTDKRAALEESARILRPFGRVALAVYMLEPGGPILGRRLAPTYPS